MASVAVEMMKYRYSHLIFQITSDISLDIIRNIIKPIKDIVIIESMKITR